MIIDENGIHLPGISAPDDALITISFAGRRIWTTKVADQQITDTGLYIAWPAALIPRLDGTTRVECQVRNPSGEQITDETQQVSFGSNSAPLELVDPSTGAPQIVNKWGRLAKSFEDKPPEFIDHVLTSAEQLIALLHETMGIDAFVTGGTLLGPVRDGRIMPHDDDADLAYLSSYDNPSDVVTESFAIEAMLREHGHDVIRHSSGHLQIFFPGSTMTDSWYVDIFTYFVVNGYFYGTFHAREKAEKVPITPLSQISVAGHQLPAPHDTDAMLTAIYGPSWRTPDPAFHFETPPAAQRRYYWWFNHFDSNREDWEDFWRANHDLPVAQATSPGEPSFTAWARQRLTPGSSLYDIGCGDGATLCELGQGRHALGSDYARPALLLANQRAEATGSTAQFFYANQYSTRQTSHALGLVAAMPGPIDVIAENLFDVMHFLGWDVTMRVMRRLLDRGGKVLVAANGGVHGALRSPDEPDADRFFTPDEFTLRVERFGMTVVECEQHDGDPRLFYTLGKA